MVTRALYVGIGTKSVGPPLLGLRTILLLSFDDRMLSYVNGNYLQGLNIDAKVAR